MGRDDPHEREPERLEHAILDLLAARGIGKTICPSEAAREVGGNGWRDLMPFAREAAARLDVRGQVVVTQKGDRVDALTARGPIRVGLVISGLRD